MVSDSIPNEVVEEARRYVKDHKEKESIFLMDYQVLLRWMQTFTNWSERRTELIEAASDGILRPGVRP